MFCTSCGNQVADDAGFCPQCGARTAPERPAGTGEPQYGATEPAQPQYGAAPQPGPAYAAAPVAGAPKSKIAAALLGILLGSLGIHRFYLGYTTIGIIQLVLGLAGILTCGITTIASGIWGLIEGILILTGSIDRDAQGQPLAQ